MPLIQWSYGLRLARLECRGLKPTAPLGRCLAGDQRAATELEHLRAGVVLEELIEERSGDVVGVTELRDCVGRGINRAKLFRLRQRSASRETFQGSPRRD